MSRMTVVAGSVMALGVAYVGSSWLLGHVAQQKYQTEFERVVRLLGADSVEMRTSRTRMSRMIRSRMIRTR